MDTELVSALRDNARRVLSDHCTSRQIHRLIDQQADQHDMELWRLAADLGWLALAIPEKYGGLGAGLAELSVLQEELGRFVAPIPFHASSLVARALAFWPHDNLRSRWLDGLATGQIVGALGPIADSDATLVAVQRDGGFQITGECLPVVSGDIAQIFLVPVQTNTGRGMALIGRSSGIEIKSLPVADRTRTVASIHFHNVQIPREQILCATEAKSLSDRLADEARLLTASDSVGGAQAILDTTVEYLKIRVQFGKPIGSFQALKHRCADHKVALEASKRLLKQAMSEADLRQPTAWASSAKFYACDCYAAIAADSVQMHGGIGFTWEHDAHVFLKRALFNQFLFGNSAQQQDRVAELMLLQDETL